ncbi:MAG: long-chain fatty acid--CoA ligase [Pseudomonadota bacterium]
MNVGEWPLRWSVRAPRAICLKCGDLELTQQEFNLRINRLSHALLEHGIRKGERIAALLANSHVFLEILFAASKIGAVMVPLNFRLAAPELEYILNDSEPRMLFYSPEFLPLAEALRGKTPGLDSLICETAGGAPGDPTYDAWIKDRDDSEPQPEAEVGLEDPHFIMYTSGTTGRPKGAVVRQGQTQWNAINGIHTYSINQTDVSICCAPLFHIGALHASATPNLYAGCKLVIQRFFDPAGVIKLIETEKAASMFGIPVMFLFMSHTPEFANADFSSVKWFVAGGSPCPKSLIETYLNKGVTFNQGYGMTETATAITALRPEDALRKLGSCGKPVFHTDIRIVDLQGRDLPAGELGEVLVKGPNVIKEYWRKPKETAETIENGWLRTGDMGYLDEEGYLFLVDRRKDMYISGGENVYPAEVEDVIMGFEEVADVGVIGIPDDRWGEVGLAVVVKAPGVETDEAAIIAKCQGRLGKYKIPKKVVFTTALPRTLTGKILKKDLRLQYGVAK